MNFKFSIHGFAIRYTSCVLIFMACGCAGVNTGGSGNGVLKPGPNMAVTVETRTYLLGRIPDQEMERAFHNYVMASAKLARKRVLRGKTGIGFNYTLTPKGAVYPFSDVEVACIVQSRYVRRYGRSLCSEMFMRIDRKFKK